MRRQLRTLAKRPSIDGSRKRRWPISISCTVSVIAASLVFAACSSSPSSPSSGSTNSTSGSSAPVVKTASNAKYGSILVDNEGNTLYTLVSNGAPIACSGSCPHVWPPLLVPAGDNNLTGASGVTGLGKSSSGTVVEYQGYPLFHYSGDTAPGQANGNGISSYGGTWYVIKVGTKPGTPVT